MHHVKHVSNRGPTAFVARGELPYYILRMPVTAKTVEAPRFADIDYEIQQYLHPKYYLNRK